MAPDLAAVLEKNKPAARSFASFTPSQRKDYIALITDAKRQETREKRLAATIAWVRQGKLRNGKYIKCYSLV